MSDQLIPVSTVPNQAFQVALTVDSQILQLRLAIRYSEMASLWHMSVSDILNNLLVDSVPLVTGDYPAANVLQQQAYLKIGSAYVLNYSGTSAIVLQAPVPVGYGEGGYGDGGYGGGGLLTGGSLTGVAAYGVGGYGDSDYGGAGSITGGYVAGIPFAVDYPNSSNLGIAFLLLWSDTPAF